MVYKNLFNRLYISVIFIFIYICISFYNFNNILYLIIFIYLMILLEVWLNFKKYKIFIFTYLSISFIALFYIDFEEEYYSKFNLMIIIIVSFDIFSYLVGSFTGKIKLSRFISPNKTLEGLLGGFFMSIIISIIFSYFFNIIIDLNLLIFIILIIISAFFGDMVESIFKRLNFIKNSSNYIPGHGGFFDRFDSFVLSIFVYSIIINIL